jgi:hypothetical protein
MPSQIKSDLKSESAQDAERHVVRGSTNKSAQDAEHLVVRSSKKSQTSRANGAKSRGPVTPEGRAKSAHNSIRHGLRAKSVVLPTESKEEFQSLLDSYNDQFDPQTGVEMELVEAMAVARWRLRRVCTIETNLLTNEMLRHAGDIEESFDEMDRYVDDDDSLTWVFKRLADNGPALALLVRYEGALNRSYDKAFKQLHLLQSTRNRPQPNEPKTDSPISPFPVSPVQAGPVENGAGVPSSPVSTQVRRKQSPEPPPQRSPEGLASPKPPIYT